MLFFKTEVISCEARICSDLNICMTEVRGPGIMTKERTAAPKHYEYATDIQPHYLNWAGSSRLKEEMARGLPVISGQTPPTFNGKLFMLYQGMIDAFPPGDKWPEENIRRGRRDSCLGKLQP